MTKSRAFIVVDRRRADTIWKGMRVYRPAVQKKSEIGGKGLEPLLRMSVKDRVQKYFEFCRAFDLREDHVIRDHFQQHSHRLHWQEHPFVNVMRGKRMSMRDRIWATLVFSFTNEHWQTFMTLVEGGPKAMRKRFETERHSRMDLFQIYYPKGTVVREWLIDGTKAAADAMADTVRGRNRRWGMMNLAKEFNAYFVREQRFNALYPCKNFARYFAMAFPDTVDPESWIHPGTGSFRGLQQIFGGKLLMSSAKYDVDRDGKFLPLNADAEILKEQFRVLCEHPDSPIREYRQLNHEDKACFFAKRLMHEVGVQKPTARIPYTWIFPSDWNLRTGQYDRDPRTPEFQI